MSDPKSDEMLVTGAHRAWAGETTGPVVRTGVREQRTWLERAQPPLPANPRHAAITRSLYSWTNYKSWTDKVRHNWDKDKSGK